MAGSSTGVENLDAVNDADFIDNYSHLFISQDRTESDCFGFPLFERGIEPLDPIPSQPAVRLNHVPLSLYSYPTYSSAQPRDFSPWSNADRDSLLKSCDSDASTAHDLPVDLSFLNQSSNFGEPVDVLDCFKNVEPPTSFTSGPWTSKQFTTQQDVLQISLPEHQSFQSSSVQHSTNPGEARCESQKATGTPSFADVAKQRPRLTSGTSGNRPIAPVQPRQRRTSPPEQPVQPVRPLPPKSGVAAKRIKIGGAYGLDEFEEPAKVDTLPVATVEPSVARSRCGSDSSAASCLSSPPASVQRTALGGPKKRLKQKEIHGSRRSTEKKDIAVVARGAAITEFTALYTNEHAGTKTENLRVELNSRNRGEAQKAERNNNLSGQAKPPPNVRARPAGKSSADLAKKAQKDKVQEVQRNRCKLATGDSRNTRAATGKSKQEQRFISVSTSLLYVWSVCCKFLLAQRDLFFSCLRLGWRFCRRQALGPAQSCYSWLQPQLFAAWAYLGPLLFTVEKQPHRAIQLPTRAEDAMRRLTSLKSRDAYSILGVGSTASSHEISYYYEQQAMLVHPDKHNQAGCEEAFVIFGHAFSLIGCNIKRQKYDQMLQQRKDECSCDMKDKFRRLEEKLQQAQDLVPCTGCEGTHLRIAVDRPLYEARFCLQCGTRHAVREGDAWVETSWYGLRWFYYVCMQGQVYDVTSWADCQQGNFNRIKPNSHNVALRIMTSSEEYDSRSELEECMQLLERVASQKAKDTEATQGSRKVNKPAQPTRKPRKKKRL